MGKKLLESKGKYHILLEELPDPIFSFTPEGQYEYANQAYAKEIGKPAEKIIGKRIWDVFSKEEADKRFTSLNWVLRTGKKKAMEVCTPRADGDRYYLTMYTPIKNTTGKVVSAICSSKDITERKKMEEALRKSEREYRQLVESINQGIFVAQDGMLKFLNPMSKKIIGHSEPDLTTKQFTEFIHPDDREMVLDYHTRRLRGEIFPTKYEFRIVTNDGITKWTEIDSIMIQWDGKPATLAFLSDITERKLLKSQLLHAQKMEAIGTLAGGIAHDFNNMLAVIQGFTALLLMEIDQSHPNYEKLKKIEEQVESGATLTRQLLGFARGGKYEVKPTDINNILRKTSDIFGRTKKEIFIHQKFGGNLWSVEVDQGQMEQVFMNLYVNAWQAMPNGGNIYLETENVHYDDHQALSYAVNPGKYVKVTVTDTGTGMDRETMDRIFEPFFTTKKMGKGTGLGLATVYGIIQGHKGMINVDSKVGQGTKFTIYLSASEKEIMKVKSTTGSIAKGTETILLVDDEKMVLEMSRDLLKSLGYRVYAVGSGQEAIAVYMEKRNKIDLVILDMILPGIPGGDTFDRLREINSDIRVILCSGYSIDGNAQKIMDRGCNGFIQKPFSIKDLSQKLREVLSKKT
ncbi:MAG: PAS domain S-box protein [Smithellaceae bacterium]